MNILMSHIGSATHVERIQIKPEFSPRLCFFEFLVKKIPHRKVKKSLTEKLKNPLQKSLQLLSSNLQSSMFSLGEFEESFQKWDKVPQNS